MDNFFFKQQPPVWPPVGVPPAPSPAPLPPDPSPSPPASPGGVEEIEPRSPILRCVRIVENADPASSPHQVDQLIACWGQAGASHLSGRGLLRILVRPGEQRITSFFCKVSPRTAAARVLAHPRQRRASALPRMSNQVMMTAKIMTGRRRFSNWAAANAGRVPRDVEHAASSTLWYYLYFKHPSSSL